MRIDGKERKTKGNRTESVIESEPKRRSIKKTEARVKYIAKKYQAEGSKKMMNNRKKSD